MNTKLSVILLSGLSLALSVGAVAVSGDDSGDYLNWSYAMGDTPASEPSLFSAGSNTSPTADQPLHSLAQASKSTPITCTNGCPGRPEAESPSLVPDSLLVTYEDEAAPVADFSETDYDLDDPFAAVTATAVRNKEKNMAATSTNSSTNFQGQTFTQHDTPAQNDGGFDSFLFTGSDTNNGLLDTQYAQSSVQYPVTRQYPISVEYPLMVQRNMTVEQPVIMQQPVIVRRPVVMQQDITVQRQPTILQQQPVVMQQQPTYVQQQPMLIQAPAGAVDYSVLSGMGGFNQFAQPMMPTTYMAQPAMTSMYMTQPTASYVPTYMPVQQQPVMMATQPLYLPMGQPQQYQVQGQIMAQPLYMMPQSTMPSTQTPVQQPVYSQQSY